MRQNERETNTVSDVELSCKIDRVLFKSDLFAICSCVVLEKEETEKIPGPAIFSLNPDTNEVRITAKGYGLSTEIGKRVKIEGSWVPDKKRLGCLVLDVSVCEADIGTGKEAIVSYLSSGIMRGIGPKIAEQIYKHFGDKTLDILDNQPRSLLLVPGIGKERYNRIMKTYNTDMQTRHLTKALAKYGVSYRKIVRIRQTLGENATGIIQENPYILCDVEGFGFQTADRIAVNMGIEKDSEYRIKAAIKHKMVEIQSDGHLYFPQETLIESVCTLLGLIESDDGTKGGNINQAIIEKVKTVCDCLIERKELVCISPNSSLAIEKENICVAEGGAIFLTSVFDREQLIARAIANKLSEPKDTTCTDEARRETIEECIEMLGLSLDATQEHAVLLALENPLSIITGGPGTGKTSILKAIIKSYYTEHPDAVVALAAPTGRAARRMAQQTGMEAHTIHSMLELRPDDKTDIYSAATEADFVDADFIVIDESSMIDSFLMSELMYRVGEGTKLLFLGDVNQLPSVGAGNVLRELLSCPLVPKVKLEKVYRQDDTSVIPVNAAIINAGNVDEKLVFNYSTFKYYYCQTEEEGADKIAEIIQAATQKRSLLKSTQILCPMKRRGACCTNNLNEKLHDIVNPPDKEKEEVIIDGMMFRLGDKVMQTRNIERVENGDIGYIVAISHDQEDVEENDGTRNSRDVKLAVMFDGRIEPIIYDYDAALDLVHADAITIHKSQGGEYTGIIVPVFSSMSYFFKRNMLYTAITRAKKQVVLVTDLRSIKTAIGSEDTSKRNTLLSNSICFYTENE